MPEPVRGNDDGEAFYGVLEESLAEANGQADAKTLDEVEIANAALDITEIIRKHHIVDVWSNEIAQNEMRNAIDDYYYDVLREQKGLILTDAQLNDLENKIMNLARARFPD